MLTKSQANRLGDRLRSGESSKSLLQELETFRLGYLLTSEKALVILKSVTSLPISARDVKSTPSIVAKLIREKGRLAEIQDIVGCRIICGNILEQDQLIAAVASAFADHKVIDRRANPKNGYRSVHAVVRVDSVPFEVQIRTLAQHQWAETSERLADQYGQEVKYGGGPERLQRFLMIWSDALQKFERSYPKQLPADSGWQLDMARFAKEYAEADRAINQRDVNE